MKGIDVSNNQGSIDFAQVKNSGIEVVYIKASEGLTFNDPVMQTNYNNARAQGLKVGLYHFMRENDPVQEAIHFLNLIKGLDYDCIPMLDVESSGLQDGSAVSRVQEFVNYCKSQGVEVGLYTYKSFLEDYMNSNTLGLPLWIAEYNVSKPNIDIDYVGFQYSEKGQVLGINTNCDLDEFNDGIFLNGGKKKVKNLVIYSNDVDKRAAEYLADYLECPVISNGTPFDYSAVENVYAVGGGEFTSYAKQVIKGADRYETVKEVLHFCGKLW